MGSATTSRQRVAVAFLRDMMCGTCFPQWITGRRDCEWFASLHALHPLPNDFASPERYGASHEGLVAHLLGFVAASRFAGYRSAQDAAPHDLLAGKRKMCLQV